MAHKRLDQFLFDEGLVQSRSQGANFIKMGKVRVDGKVAQKAHTPVDKTMKIEVVSENYVSRAGDKLASIAEDFALDFDKKIVLDVGSSTGGFTDFALQNGAKKVYAVDVGTNQLHGSLRANPKVMLMEKTDIREVDILPDKIDIILADVSFVSILKLVPAIKKLMAKDTYFVAMVKPQFESEILPNSKHKGVIKNDTMRRQILKLVEQDLASQFKIMHKKDSSVAGQKGNLERFYCLQKY